MQPRPFVQLVASFIVSLWASWAFAVPLHAQGITLRAEGDQLTQGEPGVVKLIVRGSRTRPVVTPPHVPYVQIEPAGVKEVAFSNAKPTGKSAEGKLADAIGSLQERTARLSDDLAKQGQATPGVLDEHQDMLRDIRRQALAALSRGNGPVDYEIDFRVTAQRAGELTLPPFQVKVGSQTHLTKPLKFNVVASSNSASTANRGSTSSLDSITGPEQIATVAGSAASGGPGLTLWHGLLALLGGACIGLLATAIGRRRSAVSNRLSANGYRQAQGPGCRLADGREPVADRRPQSADEVAALVMDGIRIRCQLPAGELTPVEAAEALTKAGAAGGLAPSAQTLLEECQAARFAPKPVPVVVEDLAARARLVLAELRLSPVGSPH
jgi:hypothetical protein